MSELPAFGPSEVFGGVDELEPAVAVVRVAVALTRTQLVTALGISFAGIAAEQTPEALTDGQVRQEVEGYLASEALSELDRQMERDEGRVFSPESQRVMQVLAAAVDRAYPPVTAGEEITPDLESFAEAAPDPEARTADRVLLQAVLEAIAIPYPATVGDSEVHDRILTDRVIDARVALEGVLSRGDDPAWSAGYLRERIAEKPATGYRAAGEKR